MVSGATVLQADVRRVSDDEVGTVEVRQVIEQEVTAANPSLDEGGCVAVRHSCVQEHGVGFLPGTLHVRRHDVESDDLISAFTDCGGTDGCEQTLDDRHEESAGATGGLDDHLRAEGRVDVVAGKIEDQLSHPTTSEDLAVDGSRALREVECGQQ